MLGASAQQFLPTTVTHNLEYECSVGCLFTTAAGSTEEAAFVVLPPSTTAEIKQLCLPIWVIRQYL